MPGQRDVGNEFTTGLSIAPQSATSTITGTGVDFNDCGPAITVETLVGDIGAGTTVDVTLQESDDDGVTDAYAAITGAAQTQLTATDDDSVAVDTFFNRSKRFVRALATYAGSSPDALLSSSLKAEKSSY